MQYDVWDMVAELPTLCSERKLKRCRWSSSSTVVTFHLKPPTPPSFSQPPWEFVSKATLWRSDLVQVLKTLRHCPFLALGLVYSIMPSNRYIVFQIVELLLPTCICNNYSLNSHILNVITFYISDGVLTYIAMF